jgi:hypothetical protein
MVKLRLYGVCLSALLVAAGAAGAEDDEKSVSATLKPSQEHMSRIEMRRTGKHELVDLIDRPCLSFSDSARANQNGTLWAFGTSGRPVALLELYQPDGESTHWIHAVSLSSIDTVTMTTPTGAKWTPEKHQLSFRHLPNAAAPHEREGQRIRQMKELARRFSAHEFWDPDNSRFELRLLVQPVHRYSDAEREIQDAAIFVFAHGTNPEVLLLMEAQGKSLEEAKWQFAAIRLGSAEMHVALDDKEVWTVGRTPGVVGKPTDPYWLFLSPAEHLPKE